MLYSDSIVTEPVVTGEELLIEQPQPQQYQIRHPYQVLRRLPKNATPEQQDSAIQAVFQPKQIRYSEQPDTLQLPGFGKGKSINDVSLPQYYNESYFKNNPYLRSDISGRLGMAGDPVPYRTANDDIITMMMMSFTLLTIIIASRMSRFISQQFKLFFAPPQLLKTKVHETSGEEYTQVFLILQACCILGMTFFNYVQHTISDTFTLDSEYKVITIFIAEFIAYFVLKFLLDNWVNHTFLDSSASRMWNRSKLFLCSMMGIAFLPVSLLNIYFNLSDSITLFYIGFVIVIYQILLFFKAIRIIFNQKVSKYQIILYLCTLEILPLIAMWGILMLSAYNLTITD